MADAQSWQLEFANSALKGTNMTIEETIKSLKDFTEGKKYNTIYADPPWQFQNRTGKVAPEHKRLTRYETMTFAEIAALPVSEIAADKAHLYLWCPNALLPEGLEIMDAWGFEYKTHLIWEKIRKDGQPDGRGVGFYFRNVTEMLLFGIRKRSMPNRTLDPARSQVNLIRSVKREHSRKPDEFIPVIEACSQSPRIELFCRGTRDGWDCWGSQADADYEPDWATYANHTVSPVHAAAIKPKRKGKIVEADGQIALFQKTQEYKEVPEHVTRVLAATASVRNK